MVSFPKGLLKTWDISVHCECQEKGIVLKCFSNLWFYLTSVSILPSPGAQNGTHTEKHCIRQILRKWGITSGEKMSSTFSVVIERLGLSNCYINKTGNSTVISILKPRLKSYRFHS